MFNYKIVNDKQVVIQLDNKEILISLNSTLTANAFPEVFERICTPGGVIALTYEDMEQILSNTRSSEGRFGIITYVKQSGSIRETDELHWLKDQEANDLCLFFEGDFELSDTVTILEAIKADIDSVGFWVSTLGGDRTDTVTLYLLAL